jgi:hypothetical protein
MSAIDQYLRSGYGVGLGILGPGAHAVTAWGFRYDSSTGNYLGVYLSDSDDNKNSSTPPDTRPYYSVSLSNGKWYLQNYSGSNSWYIGEVEGLKLMSIDPIASAIGSIRPAYTSAQIDALIKLYTDGKMSVAWSPLVIGDLTWSFLSGNLPGDPNGTRPFGDFWTANGKYYIKLGSGLEGDSGQTTPEPATMAGLSMLIIGFAIKRVRRRSFKYSPVESQ